MVFFSTFCLSHSILTTTGLGLGGDVGFHQDLVAIILTLPWVYFSLRSACFLVTRIHTHIYISLNQEK